MPDSAVGSAADDMLTNSGLLPSQSHSRESYSTSLVPYNAEDVSMGRSIAQTSLETSPESIVVPAEGSVLHTDMAVRLHGDVSHGQAQIDGPQSYSLVPHVCETLPGDTRSTSNIPANGPPEIQAVINCHTSRTPVSIVLCADSSLLPFALPEQYGCVYLGFFNLTDVRIKVSRFSIWYSNSMVVPTHSYTFLFHFIERSFDRRINFKVGSSKHLRSWANFLAIQAGVDPWGRAYRPFSRTTADTLVAASSGCGGR